MSKAPLYAAGTVFALFALIHLYRLYSHFSIVIGATEVPYWVNIIGAIVGAALSYWMFSSACSKCCK